MKLINDNESSNIDTEKYECINPKSNGMKMFLEKTFIEALKDPDKLKELVGYDEKCKKMNQ